MKSIFDETARIAILRRLTALEPDSPRRWGSMTVDRAVAHLSDQIRLALGEIAQRPPRGIYRFAPLRYLGIYILPWPRGRIRGPREAFTTAPGRFSEDVATLSDLVERLAAAEPADLCGSHPLFGPMSRRDWGVLTCRHLDHHLKQFGA